MNIQQLIKDFAKEQDVPITTRVEGESGEGPSYRATFENGAIAVDFTPQSRNTLRLEGEIAQLDPTSDEGARTLTTLLRGNLALLPSQTGSLTLSRDGQRVILFELVNLAEANPHTLTESVESFLNRLDAFHRGLAAAA
ncbi:MAG: CesT family type III secretion system chaperone [Verrucomicrobiota bacterium]